MNRLSTEYSLLAVPRSPSVCQISWNVALDLGIQEGLLVFLGARHPQMRTKPSGVLTGPPHAKPAIVASDTVLRLSTGVASYGEPGGPQATIPSGLPKTSWAMFGSRYALVVEQPLL